MRGVSISAIQSNRNWQCGRSGTQRGLHVFTPRRHRTRQSAVVGWLVKRDTQQQHQTELDPPRPAPLTNLQGQRPTRWVVDWLPHTHRAAAAAAVKLMPSVSVSFRSARAAVNANETGYRRQYMQRPTSPCNNNSTALGTWSAGKEPDALQVSWLLTVFFTSKKFLTCLWGCIPPSSPWIRHCIAY